MACHCACTIIVTIVATGIMYSIIHSLIPHDKIIPSNVTITNSSDILSYKAFRNLSYGNMFENRTEEKVKFFDKLGNKVNLTKVPLYQSVSKHQEEGCICKGYGCACCETLCVPEISLNDTGCLNFAYLPDEYGIAVSLTIDGYAIINETISARNPPPLCMEPPEMDNILHICIRFYDLDVANKKFHACVLLEMRMFHIFSLKEWHLGCFNINFASMKQGLQMKKLLKSTATNATGTITSVKPSLDWKAFKQVLLSKMNSSDSTLVTSASG